MIFRAALCTLLATFSGLASDWFVVRLEAPSYPTLASQARIQGLVRLRLVIDGQGRVTRASVLAGHPVLARAAEANIMKWRFAQPCPEKASATEIQFTFEFRLEGETSQAASTGFRYEHPYRATVVSQARHWTPKTDRAE